MSPIELEEVFEARRRIRPFLPPTPLRRYAALDELVGHGIELWIKHENHNPTNAFKARNGLAAMTMLSAEDRRRGVVSASRGNHGQALAWAGARALLTLQPSGMLPVSDITLDLRVWLLALGLTTLSGLVFGLAPALFATRQSPADALNSGGRATAGGGMRRWARQLVVAEVALAVMLTVGAGLLLRSYDRLSKVPAGFDVYRASCVWQRTTPAGSRSPALRSSFLRAQRADPCVVLSGAARTARATIRTSTSATSAPPQLIAAAAANRPGAKRA